MVALTPAAPLMAARDPREQMERYVASHQQQIVGELADLLAIPNVAADKENIRKNAEFLKAMLERRGLTASLLETDGNPLVHGELKAPGATRTLLFTRITTVSRSTRRTGSSLRRSRRSFATGAWKTAEGTSGPSHAHLVSTRLAHLRALRVR